MPVELRGGLQGRHLHWADTLAKTLAFDDRGTVDGKPAVEVLRRMRTAPPGAQRALVARATDPSNGAKWRTQQPIQKSVQVLGRERPGRTR
jgi:hypothetical protein